MKPSLCSRWFDPEILNPRLALQASNVAFGSVINLNFHFLYLHYGNK